MNKREMVGTAESGRDFEIALFKVCVCVRVYGCVCVFMGVCVRVCGCVREGILKDF